MIIRSAKIVICSLYPVHYDCHTLCQSLFCSPRLSLDQPMFMFCSAQQSHTQSRLHAVISAKDFCSPQESQVDWDSLASFVHHDTHTFSKTGLVVSFIMIVTCSLEKIVAFRDTHTLWLRQLCLFCSPWSSHVHSGRHSFLLGMMLKR